MEIDNGDGNAFPLTSEQTDSLWMEGLERGSQIRFRVASGSMHPTLARGDCILVRGNTPESKLHLGDIILFYFGNRWIVHRVIGSGDRDGLASYWQKGDAEYRAILLPASAVAGIVIAIEHGDKSVDLESRGLKLVNRLIGACYAIDWKARRGNDAAGGKGEAVGRTPAWQLKAAAGFRKGGTVLVRVGARWMYADRRRPRRTSA